MTGNCDCCVGVTGLGYENVFIPRPGFTGEVGEVKPLRGGEFLPTLSGTVGLRLSLCMSMSRVSSATGVVSAARAFDAPRSFFIIAGDIGFRGTGNGLFVRSSFRGGAISDRPIARLQGSRGLAVSTGPGGGLVPIRVMRSEKLTFLLSGPLTETW